MMGAVSTESRVTLVPATGRFEDRSPTGAGAATLLRAGRFEVPPGWRLPLRIAEFHVMFVGVREQLRFTAGGVEHDLGPGAVLWLPRHRAHQATAPHPLGVERAAAEKAEVYVLHFVLPHQEHPASQQAQLWRLTGRSAQTSVKRCAGLVSLLGSGGPAADLRGDAELNLLLADLHDVPVEPGDSGPSDSSGRSGDIARVLDHITRHTDQPLRVTELADLAGLHRGHFSLLFSRLTGLSPSQYVTAARIARARELLEHSELTLDTIADRCGFSSASHLARRFKEYEGLAPGTYRDRHAPPRSELGRSTRR